MDDTDTKIVAIVVVVCLAIVAYGGYRWVRGAIDESEVEDILVELGDTVTMNYTGFIHDERIYGSELRVFDSSLTSVANDNNTYPKTLTYTWRAGSPFTFDAGSNSVIQGWDNNVLGMKVGESQTWHIPAEQAYNPRLPSLLVSYNITEHCPVYESMSRDDFIQQYPGTQANVDTSITHAYWGWPANVFLVTDTEVTILNLPANPSTGKTYETNYGWDTQVTNIDQSADGGKGDITMEHRPQISDVIDLAGMAAFDENSKYIQDEKNGQQRPGPGIVADVGTSTFQVDYNSETYGVELIFQVTLEEIVKG
ncbi:MAG: FKBP-type peptidyl-prolyl cis-trans isomerase [Thermoplasmata archaeon]|nr:FKBP-type peptidyl-prolyl cis-trans isomerase [Thermoplasmata archaeon]